MRSFSHGTADRALLTVACLAVAAFAMPAAAQRRSSVVAGTIHDSLGAPIPGVQVVIADSPFGVRSDSLGNFRLPTTREGKQDVHFRRLGFDSTSVRTELGRDSLITLAVVMNAVVQDLAEQTITAEMDRMQALQGFYDRKRAGFGYFITRDEIEQRHATMVSDAMRMIPGVHVVRNGGRSGVRFSRTSIGTHDCPPQVYVDGVMAKGMEIDDLTPSDIEGMEIYQGASVIPPQFNDRFGNAICGVIAVWTRVPGT